MGGVAYALPAAHSGGPRFELTQAAWRTLDQPHTAAADDPDSQRLGGDAAVCRTLRRVHREGIVIVLTSTRRFIVRAESAPSGGEPGVLLEIHALMPGGARGRVTRAVARLLGFEDRRFGWRTEMIRLSAETLRAALAIADTSLKQ